VEAFIEEVLDDRLALRKALRKPGERGGLETLWHKVRTSEGVSVRYTVPSELGVMSSTFPLKQVAEALLSKWDERASAHLLILLNWLQVYRLTKVL